MDHRKRSCVFGCDIHGVTLHMFPNPEKNPNLFSDWIAILGENLKETKPINVYKNKRVCGRHFEASLKTTGHRLMQSAKPTKNLKCIQKSIVTIIETEHNYYHHPIGVAAMSNAPSTSAVELSIPKAEQKSSLATMIKSEHYDCCLSPPFPVSKTSTSFCATSSESSDPESVPMEVSAEICVETIKKEDHIIKNARPSKSAKVSTSKKDIQRHTIPVVTRRRIKYLQNETMRLRSKINYLKRQRRVSNTQMLEKVMEAMTVSGKLFTRIQAEETNKTPKGRRYNMEEKVLALSMYKRSPKTYRFLRRILTLPSVKSLKQFLSNIKLEVGMDTTVFDELKKKVSTLQLEDQLVWNNILNAGTIFPRP